MHEKFMHIRVFLQTKIVAFRSWNRGGELVIKLSRTSLTEEEIPCNFP